ncbi:hypothetical protein [Actinomadura macra]|uniref:hypothetical protein n=1 Tax=Actinomadura macra TaxID=46164 RepID=UPI00082D2582|nr:hypothetical protein [Actinomadura macra]
MNRGQDVLTILRTLDAADRDVDPRGARARGDLARILADRPSRRPSQRVGGRIICAVIGGLVVAVAVTVVVALPSMTGGDRAFATWTPAPQGMSAKARAAAADKCREAQRGGPGNQYARELRDADAAIVERRGVWTTVVLATGKGFSALCVTDGSTRLFKDWFGSIGTPTGYTAPGPRDLVATDLGVGVIDAGHLSLAAGAAGSEIAKVVYRSPSGRVVAATVSKGRFALWLPGDDLEDAAKNGVEVEVTYSDGSAGTSRLRL